MKRYPAQSTKQKEFLVIHSTTTYSHPDADLALSNLVATGNEDTIASATVNTPAGVKTVTPIGQVTMATNLPTLWSSQQRPTLRLNSATR